MRLSLMLPRTGLFLIIWWMLTGGVASSWWIGVPAVLLAVLAGAVLLPPIPLVWHELLRFVPFFILRSLLGGVDVARRAFLPALPISPVLADYPLRLPAGLPRVFMVNIVSLLPGTLGAELSEGHLKIHVLDERRAFLPELNEVENSVARMFGLTLPVSDRGECNE